MTRSIKTMALALTMILAGVVSGTLSSIFVVGSFAVRALGACQGRVSDSRQPAGMDTVPDQISV